jgi:Barstar (barnase inhibitor)
MTEAVSRDTPENVRALAATLRSDAWDVYVLREGIRTKSAFFDAVVAAFPLDPPLRGVNDVWDALFDSLGGGLLDVPAPRIAILWPDAYRLMRFHPREYETAVFFLSHLPEQLSHGEWTEDGSPKEALVFLGVKGRGKRWLRRRR